MAILEWIGGRGFTVSDHVASAKCHIRDGQIKLYVKTVNGDEHLIRDPSDTSDFHFKLDWEKEGRKQLDALKKLIQGDKPHPEISESKKTVVRKAK